MEWILQQYTCSELMSILDGFSGYNQILVVKEDRYKMAYTTPWVTYAYNRMSFGLKNVGATFQRIIDPSFKYIIGKIMVDYQAYLTVHSKHG